jgi:colanic acid/amylovoran biosynthesis protein
MGKNCKRVVLLGASFSTGNLGVSALAWSSIYLIKKRFENIHLTILRNGGLKEYFSFVLNDTKIVVTIQPIRYSPNIFKKDHLFLLIFGVLMSRLIPPLARVITRRNALLDALLQCEVVFDITGGDSFSDIYGLTRLLRGCLLKQICCSAKKPLVLLPQTYGPFESRAAKILARSILRNCTAIFARDEESAATAKAMVERPDKVQVCPDVAFILQSVRPKTNQIDELETKKRQSCHIIGLNISGLLYYGGYSRNNMFGLEADYQILMKQLIMLFTDMSNHHVLIIPHVLPSAALAVEDDYLASQSIVEALPNTVVNRLTLVEKGLDQHETKYCIGLCDFFIGSRMHATIAALSQNIPAVGLAYSKKFSGVFKTANVSNHVIDLRSQRNEEIVESIEGLYARAQQTAAHLAKCIPALKSRVEQALQIVPD